MALDRQIVQPSSIKRLRQFSATELVVVIGLTVAVVVMAALWESSSVPTATGPVVSLEPLSEAPLAQPTSVESDLSVPNRSSDVSAAVSQLEAVTQSVAAVTLVEDRPERLVIPTQTGIVPGRPDPSEPALPDSFERYQVQRGESLFLIASARGVSVSDLVQWNWHLEENSTLIRGEWIWIPEWDAPMVADELGGLQDDGKSGRGGG